MKLLIIFALVFHISNSDGFTIEDRGCESSEFKNFQEQFENFNKNLFDNLKESSGNYSEFLTTYSS